jgi:two-component system cell cycle response regulator DivK
MSENRQTVLIVEDFEDSRRFLETWLTRKNFRVVEASDGWQAVDLAVRERPVLILMDINIPVIDGIEVACLLKENQAVQNTPIVAMTAHDSAEYRADAADVGFDDYVTKPIDFQQLETVINRLIRPDSGLSAPPVH